MKLCVCGLLAIAAFIFCFLASAQALAQNAYVTNNGSNNVSVIDTNAVPATIPVGSNPYGVAVTPDGRTAYVANAGSNTVSVIDTASNAVTATIPVGSYPVAFGLFIQPAPRFAGTPGAANCTRKSVSALAQQYGGLAHAAVALGYSNASALQSVVASYCDR